MNIHKAANLMVSIHRVFLRLPLIASDFAAWKEMAQAAIQSRYTEDVTWITAEAALEDVIERTSEFLEMLQFLQGVRSTTHGFGRHPQVAAEAIYRYYQECLNSLDVLEELGVCKELPPTINRVCYSKEFDSLRTGLYMVSGRMVEMIAEVNKWKRKQA